VVAFYLPIFALTLTKSVTAFAIDTHLLGETLYSSPPQAVASLVFDLPRPPAENVFLIGASNVELGFRPGIIGEYLDREKVIHNVAIDGSNFTLATELVDLLEAQIGKEGLRTSTMIVGIHYIQFVEDSVRWPTGSTDLRQALERSGFYRLDGDRIRPVLTPYEHRIAVNALRPYLFLGKHYRQWEDGLMSILRELRSGVPLSHLTLLGFKAEIDEQYMDKTALFWEQYMRRPGRSLSDEQFERMDALVLRLTDVGAEVVLVDLPLPEWHQTRMPLFADFQTRKVSVRRSA
jgi:hypothetical protein